MEKFTISHRKQDAIAIISATGYFGEEAGKEVREYFLTYSKEGFTNFIIDFSNCEVINSLGLSALFDVTLKISDDLQGKIFFAGMNQLMLGVVSMAGMDDFAEYVSDVDAALFKLGFQKKG